MRSEQRDNLIRAANSAARVPSSHGGSHWFESSAAHLFSPSLFPSQRLPRLSTQAICTLKDFDPVTRALLERLFGRELPAEQRVLLALLDAEFPSADAQWQAAWATINRILDKAAENLRQVSEDEFDAAVEEAMNQVRPRRQG